MAVGRRRLLYQSIPDLEGRYAVLPPNDLDRIQIPDDPVRVRARHLFGGVARHQAQHFAPSRLARADPCGRVLEHQDALVVSRERDSLSAHEVASGVWLSVLDRLGGDEVLGRWQAESLEPAADEGLGAAGDNGPGDLPIAYFLQEGPGAGDLKGLVRV